MLPGGGAQFPDMSRDLYDHEPTFAKYVDEGLGYWRKLVDFDPKELLFPKASKTAKAKATTRFKKPSAQLPAIFIIEYALAKFLIDKGLKPDGLIGHSLGENTAACLAGVFSFEAGVGLVHLRGTLFDTVPRGGMLSVPLSPDELRPHLGDALDLACENAPGLSVASGPKAALDKLQKTLSELDIEAQPIAIDIAAHSRMLEDILGPFRAYLENLELKKPALKFISNRTGEWITDGQATSPAYWVEHLRNTVYFSAGMDTLAKTDDAVYLEVGPGRALSSLAKQNPKINPNVVLSVLRHPEQVIDDRAYFLTILGRLWALGCDAVEAQFWPGESRRRVNLPTYAFQRQRYWIEPASGASPNLHVPELEKETDETRYYWAPTWRKEEPAPADIDHDLNLLPAGHGPTVNPDAKSDDQPDNQGVNEGVEDPAPQQRTIVVFVDETQLGEALLSHVKQAESDGHRRVVTVRPSDEYKKLDELNYNLCPEHGKPGYEALVKDLMANGHAPNRIVHTWLLAENETFRPGSSFFTGTKSAGSTGCCSWPKPSAQREVPRPLHIDVLTQGAQSAGQTEVIYPEQTTVHGPCMVLPKEIQGITCKTIDVPAKKLPENNDLLSKVAQVVQNPRALAQDIVSKGLSSLQDRLNAPTPTASRPEGQRTSTTASRTASRTRQIRRRRPSRRPCMGNRVTATECTRGATPGRPFCCRPHAYPGRNGSTGPKAGPSTLRDGGTYLITGGFGGLGLTIANMLATDHKANLVLVGRQPLPDKRDWPSWLANRPTDPLTLRIRAVQSLKPPGFGSSRWLEMWPTKKVCQRSSKRPAQPLAAWTGSFIQPAFWPMG